MKKLLTVFILIFPVIHVTGQDLATLNKLHNMSVILGIPSNISMDTMILNAKLTKINNRIAAQQLWLLRAAELYSVGDYDNSTAYIKGVVINFKTADFNVLKFFLYIGNYSNQKEIGLAAKYFYIMNKYELINTESLKVVGAVIAENFKREDFNDALSHYFYYHERQSFLDRIFSGLN